jgi:hypothetical protein
MRTIGWQREPHQWQRPGWLTVTWEWRCDVIRGGRRRPVRRGSRVHRHSITRRLRWGNPDASRSFAGTASDRYLAAWFTRPRRLAW